MKPLQITAHLATPIAISDDWSPSLDALLEWLWLDKRGLASPHPSPDSLIKADIPIREDSVNGELFWACSSPFYQIELEQIDRFRKRWDYQDKHCNWGKKKAKVDTTQGITKSWDLPMKLVSTPRMDWFAVGDASEVKLLLDNCNGIGKKRSYGKGQVYQWNVREIDYDWSLTKNNQVTRPIPLDLYPNWDGHNLMRWGWRSPSWLPQNQVLCVMPNNILNK